MAQALPLSGVLRVVPPAQYEAALQQQLETKAADAAPTEEATTQLASYINQQFEIMRRHRNDASAGWSDRLLAALRAFNGKYDPSKLAEIKKFKGSEVYARLIAMKCRGASALLRDVYLSPERPWGISPPPDPDVTPEVASLIQQVVHMEVQDLVNMGQPPPDAGVVRDRMNTLTDMARDTEKKNADKRAKRAEERIEELLNEGGFYKALAEFLVDLPLFPFACIKGPVVKIVPSITYTNGVPSIEQKPRIFWSRVSPFDLFFTPGVSDIEDAAIVERVRFTRADLNDLLDLPGYNHDAIRNVLDEHGRGGLYDDMDTTDSERASSENRENPHFNRSGMIHGKEFHGNVQGRMLIEQGFGTNVIQDEMRDYMVQAWVIGRHVIKVQLSPSPRKRHPYFITSFEKVPGTPVGNALPDILSDIQDVANATLRSLVNNMAISSGPQVDINLDRIAPTEDASELFPWKRWYTTSAPMGGNTDPAVKFFQPQSNAQELLFIYQTLTNLADELSAIPRYQTGSGASGGAGRTASGLAMLMGNASKLLQTVAANIDRDVMDPALSGLFDLLMLTDQTGILRGDEAIRVLGVNVAQQRETQRARQLEFLQITANPMDMQIMGTNGRAVVLRSVASELGIKGEEIVPSPETLAQLQKQMNMQQAGAQAQGGQAGTGASGDMGPRTNISGGV